MMPWLRPLVAGLDVLNRRGKSVGVRLVRDTGKSPHFIHPKHLVETPGHDKVEYTRGEFLAEVEAAGFVVEGPLEPVVYDTPWAGLIDAVGGLSLGIYARLARWKRRRALAEPGESTGFRALARKPV
jgi:hypothetical protein